LILPGCTTGTVDIAVTCEGFMDNPHKIQVLTAKPGDSFTITLCSNRTTGFEWSPSAQISDESILQQLNHEFVAPDTTVPGAAGNEIWNFRVLQNGTSTITLVYSQPWEGGEKATWVFWLVVTTE